MPRTKYPDTVGGRLKAERTRRKWTLFRLAVELSSDPGQLSRVERDKQSIGLALGQRVCALFGWNLDYLFTGSEPRWRK